MSKALSVVLAIALILLCIFWYQGCGKSDKIATLTESEGTLKTKNNTLSERVKILQRKLCPVNSELTAAQGKNTELTTTLTELQRKADETQKGNVWWCAEAGRLKELLEISQAEQKGVGGKIKALEGERDKVQREKEKALAGKADADRLLVDLRGKSEADRKKTEQDREKAIVVIEEKLKAANIEIVRLKNRVLSIEEKTKKKKVAADNFKVYVVFTAINPALHLKKEIRILAAELLPKMFGRTDDELYEIVAPVMAKMPQQDDVSTVLLLHKAWAEWKEAKRLYSRLRLLRVGASS